MIGCSNREIVAIGTHRSFAYPAKTSLTNKTTKRNN